MEKFYRIELFTVLPSDTQAVDLIDKISELCDNEEVDYYIRVFAEEDIVRKEG